VACANARYSASEEDLETTFCFLLFQLINDLPKKKQRPVVDLLVSGHAPQSESEKPFKLNEESAAKKRPRPGQFLMYFNTCNPASM
jgi:hypothetical protein